MPDQSEIFLCIMGRPKDVKEVKELLTDRTGAFNPYKMYSHPEVLKVLPNYMRRLKEESEAEYKIRMQKEHDELELRNVGRTPYRFHYGSVMNPADFPGLSYVDKEIIYTERIDSAPIEEFVTISQAFTKVAFSMKFSGSWLTHAGTVYISRGMLWYSNYRFHYTDINGFGIVLDENFEFRYLTKFKTKGMIVPPHKLQGIDRNFKVLDPDQAKYQITYFPFPPLMDDPADEYLEDDNIPLIYEPTDTEMRKYWDGHLANYEVEKRKISKY